MKVLFVISDLGGGGAERMLLKVASRLSRDFTATVVSLTGRDDLAVEFEGLGIPVVALGMRGFRSLPGAVWRLRRLVKSLQPDVVSTWMYHADLVGGLAARSAGVRAVAWNIRNSDLSPGRSSAATRALVRVNAKLSAHVPTAILCCSHAAREIHVQLGYDGTRFRIVPNGFDLRRYRPDPEAAMSVRQELAIPPKAPLIGMIARWHAQKNHAGFVEAAALLNRQQPEVCFLLAGSSCDAGNAALGRLLEQHGLGSAFRLLGARSDIPRVTAALDVATLSSVSGEAFSNVLGEAMACEVPCVATDVGDASHIVGETGKIVPPGDAGALAAAWREMLQMAPQDRHRLGRAARARVSELFELGAVTERYEQAFLALVTPSQSDKACAA